MTEEQKLPENSVKSSKKKSKDKPVKWYETWKFLIFICIIVPLTVRSLIIAPYHIPSGSMKSTLLIGDYILVSKSAYGISRYSFPLGIGFFEGRIAEKIPQRGDVVVFRPPSQPRTDYIKRLVGLPGDRVQVTEGKLYLNGNEVPRKAAGDFMDEIPFGKKPITRYVETLTRKDGSTISYYTLDEYPEGDLDNTKEFVVPEGHYFMMGDNRDNSLDSRTTAVSYVPFENLVGRADTIMFSTSNNLWKIWKWANSMRGERFWIGIQGQPEADGK